MQNIIFLSFAKTGGYVSRQKEFSSSSRKIPKRTIFKFFTSDCEFSGDNNAVIYYSAGPFRSLRRNYVKLARQIASGKNIERKGDIEVSLHARE